MHRLASVIVPYYLSNSRCTTYRGVNSSSAYTSKACLAERARKCIGNYSIQYEASFTTARFPHFLSPISMLDHHATRSIHRSFCRRMAAWRARRYYRALTSIHPAPLCSTNYALPRLDLNRRSSPRDEPPTQTIVL